MPGNRNKPKKTVPKQAVNLRKATASLNTGNSNKTVPVASGQVRTTLTPSIQRSGNGDSRVVHREFIADVISTGADFQVSSFNMNPGNEKTFPWLCRIAHNYESYRFNSLRFRYETAVSSATSGTVMLIPDYDPDDPAPISKKEAMAARGSARAQPWLSFAMVSNKEDLQKRKSYYVRSRGVEPIDRRSSDTGNLFLALSGVPALLVGELWVEYDVQLITPASPDINVGELSGANFTRTTNTVGPSNQVVKFLDVEGLPSGVQLDGNVLTFDKPGAYLLTFYSTTNAGGAGAYVHGGGSSSGVNGYAARWAAGGAGEATETTIAVNVEKPKGSLLLTVAGVLANAASDFLCSVLPGYAGFQTARKILLDLFTSQDTAGLNVGFEETPYVEH